MEEVEILSCKEYFLQVLKEYGINANCQNLLDPLYLENLLIPSYYLQAVENLYIIRNWEVMLYNNGRWLEITSINKDILKQAIDNTKLINKKLATLYYKRLVYKMYNP